MPNVYRCVVTELRSLIRKRREFNNKNTSYLILLKYLLIRISYVCIAFYFVWKSQNSQSHDLTWKITQIRPRACVPSCQRLRYEVNPTFRNSRSAIRRWVIDSSDQISCWRQGLETIVKCFPPGLVSLVLSGHTLFRFSVLFYSRRTIDFSLPAVKPVT